MKHLAQYILQAIFDLQYVYLSSAALQSYERVLTFVHNIHDE